MDEAGYFEEGTSKPVMPVQFSEMAQLQKERRILSQKLNRCEGKIDALSEEVLDLMVQAKMQSASVDGVTIYVERSIRASTPAEMSPEARAAFSEANLDYMVKERINQNTLTAYVKERAREVEATDIETIRDEGIPRVLRDHISIFQRTKVRARFS